MIVANLKCQHPDCGRLFTGQSERQYCSSACRLGHRGMLYDSGSIRSTRRAGLTKSAGYEDKALSAGGVATFLAALDRWLIKRGIAEPNVSMREAIRQHHTQKRAVQTWEGENDE